MPYWKVKCRANISSPAESVRGDNMSIFWRLKGENIRSEPTKEIIPPKAYLGGYQPETSVANPRPPKGGTGESRRDSRHIFFSFRDLRDICRYNIGWDLCSYKGDYIACKEEDCPLFDHQNCVGIIYQGQS